MNALRSILPLGLALGVSLSAHATPAIEGAPRWTASGPGLSGLGSSTILQADVESTAQDLPLASGLRDGLAPAALHLATISAEVMGATSRHLSFSSSGWTETVGLGAGGTLEARVFTFAPNVFAYRLSLDGLALLPVTVHVNGQPLPRLATPGTSSTVTSVEADLTATFMVGSDSPVVVLLASAALPEAEWDAALAAAEAITDWEAWFATNLESPQFSGGIQTGIPARTAEALALLQNALTTGSAGTLPLRAKGRLATLGLEDAGLLARALAELGPEGVASAGELLEVLRAAQSSDGRVAAQLTPAGPVLDGATRVPRFLSVWLPIAERTADDAQAERILREGLALERGILDFWAQSRDRDGDAALECNGGLEAGTPGSPRFAEIWPTTPDVPVGETSSRVPMNCVEAGSWAHALAIEAARLAEQVGENSEVLRRMASRRSLEVEDQVNGHWDPKRKAWFDYVRVGEDRTRAPLDARTHVMWAPLTAGVSRDVNRIQPVIAAMLKEGSFSANGVASVALDQTTLTIDRTVRWQGAIQPEVEWSALLALSRYGYEAESQALRTRLLERPLSSATDPVGLPIGPEDDAVAAAVHVLAASHADEDEVLLYANGGLAKARSGHFRRLFRAGDGRLLLEVVGPTPSVRPRVVLKGEEQLFSGAPMTLTIEDPAAHLTGSQVQVLLPGLASAKGTVTRADGSTEPFELGEDGWRAGAGDRLELTESTLAGVSGSGCGGCSGSGGGALSLLGAVALLALTRRRGRRELPRLS